MAHFKINSVTFVGEGYGSECVVAFEGGSGFFRFGGGRVISETVRFIESAGDDSIKLEGEYGAVICIGTVQKAEIENWGQRTGTCVGY